MTAQISDTIFYQGKSWELLAPMIPFDPRKYGLRPAPFITACRRGFFCVYEIGSELSLVRLHVKTFSGDYPPIEGVEAVCPEKSPFYVYSGLHIPIPYTGTIAIGADANIEIYFRAGYPDENDFRIVKEFRFDHGKLIGIRDISRY